MQEAGWIDGKNIRLDYRFGGDVTDINASAAELVVLAPEVIYATGLPAARALHQKTQTIPIVFTQVADPVGFGLVETIGHPGGNVTGFIVWDLSIGGKWIQLLREIAPELTRVGIIYNPDTAPYAPLSLPETKFARIDDGAHQGSGVQQHLRTARSRVCRARPSRAKHEFVRHYNRRRISLEFVEGALR